MARLENYIETLTREIDQYNDDYIDLYISIKHDQLRSIFSTFHAKLISIFKSMNSRLPTGENSVRFWAEPSRELINVIEKIEELQRILQNTEFSFSLDNAYKETIEKCKIFLSSSGGSEIPPGMEKVELYYTMPIFIENNMISINRKNETQNFKLALIGEGSYAYVYKYKDDFYHRCFAIKRAKKDLDDKELARFKQEYQMMESLRSPYVVEVYNYNQENDEFTMEFMNYTLHDFIDKNNNKLSIAQRKNICNQIIKAFVYIHSKNLLHRDISPTNILIKEYDDVFVVKISDFGLVKIPESKLTSVHTELKGIFNDPSLGIEGFNMYNMKHEIYAITIILCFVMSGKKNITNISDPNLRDFAKIGMNPDKSLRFANVSELSASFNAIYMKEKNR